MKARSARKKQPTAEGLEDRLVLSPRPGIAAQVGQHTGGQQPWDIPRGFKFQPLIFKATLQGKVPGDPVLQGTLHLTATDDQGQLDGILITDDRSQIIVTGRASSRIVQLQFDLSDGQVFTFVGAVRVGRDGHRFAVGPVVGTTGNIGVGIFGHKGLFVPLDNG